MIAAAVICEYNPFHNGHRYHIEETRRRTGADFVAAVMSGNYVQRGEPSILDKWARAEAALAGGADIVIEIPSLYAAASAQYFAEAAVDIINKIGFIDYLSFGSESCNEARIKELAALRADESEEFKNLLKASLKQGKAYPSAMENASGIKLKSNDILAVEYLNALYKSRSEIKPIFIPRFSAEHNEKAIHGRFASAQSIRRVLLSGISARDCVPETSLSIIEREVSKGRAPVTLERYEQIVMYTLRTAGLGKIKNLPYVSEGLEYRLYEAASKSADLENIIEFCTGARYTRTRITRILTALLIGSVKEMQKTPADIPYIKILGFRKASAQILKMLKKNAQIEFFAQPARAFKGLSDKSKKLLEQERRATDAYVLGYPEKKYRLAGQEFTRQVIVL